jgi:[protein-PII] uridylyltransferase
VPDFGRIVSMMQFNMYHHYTVDEHLLRAIGILAEIERGELAEQHPLTNKIIHTIENRRALFVAVFLHDIAKGRPESHSVVGGRIAKKLCPRFGLSGAETETVVWLIENHLAMSDFAQMRDLNDFKTIMDFAEIVQSPEHLKLLICLTVADIKSVGPGVWNGWKGELLRTLYYEVEPVISGGHTTITRKERLASALEELEQALSEWPQDERQMLLDKHYPAYLLNVALERKITHANMIREVARNSRKLVIQFDTDEFTEVTEITVFAIDHPSLLATVTGACAAAGANIVDAQIYTTKDGMALNSIFIQRQFSNLGDEEKRAKRISATIERTLRGEIKLPDLLKSRDKTKSRLKAFSVEPSVIIDNSRSNIFTVLEVRGLDRPGLLFELTLALFELNINVGSAHIATFGERAVDVFYVKDLTGLKITNEQRHAKIKQHLLSVFENRNAKQNPKGKTARQLTTVGSG